MVFTGSAEARMFVDSLSEYTDLIYAVVSDQYGSKQHVSGNITVISRYLDKESIKSWVERVGIRVLVDGTEIYAAGASQMIREAAEEMGLEYFKISSRIGVDFTHTSKCAGAADIVRDASYTVGNVLMIGCRELAEGVITEKDGVLKDRVVIVLPPEEENIRDLPRSGISSGKHHLYDDAAAGNSDERPDRRKKHYTYGGLRGRYLFYQDESQSCRVGEY